MRSLLRALGPPRRRLRRLRLPKDNFERQLAFMVAGAAVLSGTATLIIWTGATGFGPRPATVSTLLYIDTVLLLLLGTIIVRRVVKLWIERRRGRAGSGLHARIILLFGLIALAPAILVAVFSAVFLNFGVQAWFSERVKTAIQASSVISKAYLKEYQQNIRADLLAIANEMNRLAPLLIQNPEALANHLTAQANLRSISEAMVVDATGRVLARSPLSLTLEPDVLLQMAADETLDAGEIIVEASQGDRITAAVRLTRFIDAYLLVSRLIDPFVLQNINRTELAAAQYSRVEQSREGILITFAMIFVVVTLLLLFAAVWIALNLATQITRPISALIEASERVRGGDLSVRVASHGSQDEISNLGWAFNRMTSQLQSQQEGLIQANRALDERRRFTEAVLSGVSAGVIGVDVSGKINLPNRSASTLLSTDLDALIGRDLTEVVPEMASVVDLVARHADKTVQEEIRLIRENHPRIFNVRAVAERLGSEIIGFIITFDDITALVQAERKAAWADVARRIAHEIKNPLTPIQLAAERLSRKYKNEIRSDPETFRACTETISRQVQDIGRMVDEFYAFSRMPHPEMVAENLVEVIRNVIVLERNRYPEIEIRFAPAEPVVSVECDRRQIAQALTNVLKNAAEAITGREGGDQGSAAPGWIEITIAWSPCKKEAEFIDVIVEDNGRGLPTDNRDRLTEPYVTFRPKGAGLGLAIVKKILEDHGGDLLLGDGDHGGARVSLRLGVGRDAVGERDGGKTASETSGRSLAVVREVTRGNG
jgi:two-component system nitrogen regulation sensor histidine kinase NtrY